MSEFSHSTRNYYSHNVLLDVLARIVKTLKFPSTPQLISAVVHQKCVGILKQNVKSFIFTAVSAVNVSKQLASYDSPQKTAMLRIYSV